MELGGRTILLTGATGGLGRAIAQALAAKGARLVLSSRQGDELERLAANLPGEGHRTLVADLAADGAAERLVAEAGELDGMVANAGIGVTGRVDAIDAERVRTVMRLNFEVPVMMARAIAPALRERGSGHLVFVASLAAKGATGRHALYAGTKAGLRSFAIGFATISPATGWASRSSAPGSSARPACSPTRASARR
jgi:short-subunit dehydrogenase